MFYLLKNRKRAKDLLKEEEKRLELERLNNKLNAIMKEEIKSFLKCDINFLNELAEVNVYSKDVNPATLKKEMARVKLALYIKAPNLYSKTFGEKPFAMLDTVYIMNSEGSHYPKSITHIEDVLENSLKRSDFPPKLINLDAFDEASYYLLCSTLSKDLSSLKKFLNEMKNLSNI